MIALFPGRFQPPHIGHILTLVRLCSLYDKIIVAVSTYTFGGEKPHIIEPDESVKVLKEIFELLPKLEIIGPIPGFLEREDLNDYPYFDEVISGDPLVIQHARKLHVKCTYVPCSTVGGMEIHATLIRKALSGT